MLYKNIVLLSALAVLLCSCAPNSRKQMESSGEQPLSAEELYTLVAGKTLHLTSTDFDGQLLFLENGSLSAKNWAKEKDTGKWDITTDGELCLEFSTWMFGDKKCYSLFADKTHGRYIFFTPGGARSYNGVLLSRNPSDLQQVKTTQAKTSYLKQKQEETAEPRTTYQPPAPAPIPAPEPDSNEMRHLLAKTASNCPGCNLEGADLSRSSLIEANLAGANLAGANFRGANLRRANLTGADLSGADLTAANLPGANLTDCDLRNANFSKANLVKADLTGAQTGGAIFTKAHLEGTKGLKY